MGAIKFINYESFEKYILQALYVERTDIIEHDSIFNYLKTFYELLGYLNYTESDNNNLRMIQQLKFNMTKLKSGEYLMSDIIRNNSKHHQIDFCNKNVGDYATTMKIEALMEQRARIAHANWTNSLDS